MIRMGKSIRQIRVDRNYYFLLIQKEKKAPKLTSHYTNMHMQYAAILKAVK